MSLWSLPGKGTFLCILLLPFSFTALQAQNDEIRRTFPLTNVLSHPPSSYSTLNDVSPVKGTLQVIAVMVEFQPDDNRFTSGNGTFDQGAIPWLEDPGTNVDALPHDRTFFEGRLEFVKNYFEKVSGSMLSLEYDVLPDIIRLDQPMEYYSPVGEDPEFEPLALLARDTWSKAAVQGLFESVMIDPDSTAFVIFHAGIGRDIELTGTVLEKTPQDIPSIYMGLNALRDLLGEPSFEGFSTGDNGFRITNTIVNPRTHTRRGTDISGETFLLPLSSNGMLTAQIGSHLGLPDLFDTETGQSGIGRFGLMDGAGIFGFNGLFPPEPSAWEKIHLGWAESFTVSRQHNEPVELPAAFFKEPESIARVTLSTDEFFLVENRHRDPLLEGVTLTIQKSDGSAVEQTFTNQDTGFDPVNRDFDQFLEPGIITDVSNYDWALPGGYDEDGDRELNGGMLIWHIDESVIRRTIADNRINANPDHRGVELKEADGAQDIGRPTAVGLSDNNPNGWAFDFWWRGNNASVTTRTGTITFYENRFAPDTTPSNNSHSGAPSFFELFDFSDNLPIASFKIRPFQANELDLTEIKSLNLEGRFYVPDNPLLQRYPYGIQHFRSGPDEFLILPNENGLAAARISDDSEQILNFPKASYRQPFVSNLLVLAESSNEGNLTAWSWDSGSEEFKEAWTRTFAPFPGLVSSSDGQLLELDHSDQLISVTDGTGITELSASLQQTVTLNGYRAEISGEEVRFITPEGTITAGSPVSSADEDNRLYLSLVESTGGRIDLLLIADNDIYLFDRNGNNDWKRLIQNQLFDLPVLADFNRDGFLDIIYTDAATGRLEAVNLNGAVPEFFPMIPPGDVHFTGTPLVSDLNGNGSLEILVAGIDSGSMNIYAFDQRGNRVDPFPLLVGSMIDFENTIVNPILFGSNLAAVSPSGDFRIWKLPLMQDLLWPGRYGSDPWNKITGSVEPGVNPDFSFGLLNESETYNWPNPARDETHLRFQLNQSGEVNIKIATVSGRLIYNRTVESTGGAPEEILIDTSSWSSGGYYAVVTARSGNSEERKIIRIGVVR